MLDIFFESIFVARDCRVNLRSFPCSGSSSQAVMSKSFEKKIAALSAEMAVMKDDIAELRCLFAQCFNSMTQQNQKMTQQKQHINTLYARLTDADDRLQKELAKAEKLRQEELTELLREFMEMQSKTEDRLVKDNTEVLKEVARIQDYLDKVVTSSESPDPAARPLWGRVKPGGVPCEPPPPVLRRTPSCAPKMDTKSTSRALAA